MNLNCSPMPWLILISIHPVNKKHGTNLWTCFLHEAFFHKVPGQFGHQLEGRTKKTSMKVCISHVIFDAGERLHCASPLRRSLRGRPPGGSGTWPPWWRWTSRPSPGNNSQHAASVPLMSGCKARCHTPSIHSVCCWFLGESQVAFFFLTLSAPAHSDVWSRCCSAVDISEWQRCWTNPMNPLWQ